MKTFFAATLASFALSLTAASAFAAPQGGDSTPDFGVRDSSGAGPKRLFGKDDAKKKDKDAILVPDGERKDLARETKVDSILASVNGEPVTLLDVLLESSREEARLAAIFSGERLYSETAKLRKKIVEDILNRKLVYETYKDKPFPIESQFVEDMVDSIALSMGDGTRKSLEKRAKAIGATMDEIREKAKERIAVDVLIHQCCDRQVYISPKDVYDYYESHILEWATPESLELQLLLVRREGGRSGLPAKEACATIAKSLEGADEAKFKSLARSWSDGPNANEGGVMGAIDRKRLRPEFEAALKNAKTGFIAGPVETPEGFYFIRVGALAPSITQPFEKVGPDIKRKLDSSAKLVKREEYLRKLREKAVIRYYF